MTAFEVIFVKNVVIAGCCRSWYCKIGHTFTSIPLAQGFEGDIGHISDGFPEVDRD